MTLGEFNPAQWMWVGVFGAVIAFEIWAILTGNLTMSEVVWAYPTFRKVLAVFFAILLLHLFIERP